jgi:hypothetical protein
MDETEDSGERVDVLYECVFPTIRLACDYPYAIKNKLIFGIAIQIRATSEFLNLGVPHFEDRQTGANNLRTLKNVANSKSWTSFDSFIERIDSIAKEDFSVGTNDYRNTSHHRIAPFLEVGERLVTEHWQDETAKGFTFGVEGPLKISQMLPCLSLQHSLCIAAFDKYWPLSLEIRESWQGVAESII